MNHRFFCHTLGQKFFLNLVVMEDGKPCAKPSSEDEDETKKFSGDDGDKEAEINEVKYEMKKVNGNIERVEKGIERVEEIIRGWKDLKKERNEENQEVYENCTLQEWKDEKKALMEEKKALREEKKALREKEKDLRAKEMFFLQQEARKEEGIFFMFFYSLFWL